MTYHPYKESRVAPEDWQRVVDDTDGYQLIVAGPGTGKTEFIVRRTAALLEAGVDPGQVVVLCFSRRACADIRRRIEDKFGANMAPVDVTTFHSLALRILETSSGGAAPIPLTTPEQIGVVASLLAKETPSDWPLTYRGIITTSSFAAEAADFLMRCSERLLGPGQLAEIASHRADWRGLPGLYARYRRHLETINRTDYGTLLATTVGLLTDVNASRVYGGYSHVLVDEYQDSTPAQAEMAALLARESANLTVAGDPYQSIYSFRGAELRNIADFLERHPQARRLVLDRSFRVPAQILDRALAVVSGGKLPGAAGPVTPAGHKGIVESFVFDQETAEAEWIAAQVELLVRVENLSPSSIAVLVRSKRKLLRELSRALHRRGINHDPPDARLIDHPAVRLIHDLATVSIHGGPLPVTTPGQAAEADASMRRVLLGPVGGIGLGQEREIYRARRKTWSAWTHVVRERLPDRPGLAELLEDPAWATSGPAVEGFFEIWGRVEGIENLVNDAHRTDWRRAWAAFAQMLTRQAERDPALSLQRFFELTEDEGFEPTPLISHRAEGERVTLTTLHQAKGLEFDVVFIANSVEGVFPDLRRSRKMLRPELLSPERTTDPDAQLNFQVQEEMRLAYTAMTRARLRVVWTATAAGIDQGERRPSRFLVAAAGKPLTDIGAPGEERGDPVTIRQAEVWLRRRLLDPSTPAPDRLAAATLLARPPGPWWDAALFAGVAGRGADRPILPGRIQLSPSQADQFKRCPRRYALERRLRIGDPGSPYALFGTLVHDVLEQAESKIIGTGARHADITDVLQILDRVWANADFGTPQLTEAWRAKAVALLDKLYANWPNGDGTPSALEEQVSMEIEGVLWTGYVDRVEETPTGARVVDYKTSGRAPSRKEAAAAIQLAFYAATIKARGQPVVQAQFWYPRTKDKSVTTRDFGLDDLDDVVAEMGAITRRIVDETWEPIAGEHCSRCPFRLSCPAWPEGRGAFLP